MGHARSLLTLEAEDQLQIAKQVIAGSLSVRECEVLARNLGGAKQTKTKIEKTRDPNIVTLERELSDVLGTSVEISHNNKGKGKLVISFKSLDALQGVLEKIKS
jgi:ParB family chromosome partitioning protein